MNGVQFSSKSWPTTYQSHHSCYGHMPAFLFSWTSNFVLKPGGLAISSIVCAQYLIKPFYLHHDPSSPWLAKGTLLSLIVFESV